MVHEENFKCNSCGRQFIVYIDNSTRYVTCPECQLKIRCNDVVNNKPKQSGNIKSANAREISYYSKSSSNDGKKPMNNNNSSANGGCLFIVIVLIMMVIFGCTGGCTNGSGGSSDYDRAMQSYDWGDDYYYNSGSHQVEKSLYGILGE